jgi:hypothetical protein
MDNQRTCSKCGTPSTNVYVFDQGEHYACSIECRDHISENTYESSWFHLSNDLCEYLEEYVTNDYFYYTEFNN